MANFKELNDKVNSLIKAVDQVEKSFAGNADDTVDQSVVDDLEVRLEDIKARLEKVYPPDPFVPGPEVPPITTE